MVPACMATHQLAYDKRMHIQTFQIFFQVFFTPPRKECDGLMGDLIHYHSPVNVPFFLCIVIKTDTGRGRPPLWRTLAHLRQEDWLQTMFCSCSRLPAIREVVFKDMLRMRSSTFRVFRACEEASGERGALKTFLWHAVFLQRNLRTLTMSVSGWPAISSPCRSDEEPKFFPFPLSLYHWFLFTNWYSTCLISDICPFSISLQYHNPITGNLDGEQVFRLYISVY